MNNYLDPDGKSVSQKVFFKKWEEIFTPLRSIGCEIKGFDPGILLEYDGVTFDISVSFAKKLGEIILKGEQDD